MATHTVVNLKQVQDMAPEFGMAPEVEARFARVPLELEQSGLSYLKLQAGHRMPFGHLHAEQEEVYLVLWGSARVAIGDEVVELAPFDAVRIAAGVKHSVEAGDDGAELVLFGAPNTDNKDVEMDQGWWSE